MNYEFNYEVAKRYEIYSGAMGSVKEVLSTGTGRLIDALNAVANMGYQRDPFCRIAYMKDADYVDFGSYSTFIKMYRD